MHSNNASFLVKSSLQSSALNHKKIKLLLSNVEFKPKPTKNRATFSKEIIRGQLEDIAAKLNIKSPLEWEKVSTRQVRDVGGLELLTSHGGLRKVLQIAYSDVNWEEILRVKRNHWKNKDNFRLFFERIAKKYSISKPSDWGNLTITTLLQEGGTFLATIKKPLVQALREAYPGVIFREEWFKKVPAGYWKKKESYRKFFEQYAHKYGIKSPRDWGDVQHVHVLKEGGLFLKNEGRSLLQSLREAYPGNSKVEWKEEWFQNLPRGHWNKKENQRKYADYLWKKLCIQKPSDWGKITTGILYDNGASRVLHKYGNLFKFLQAVYPEIQWKVDWFSRRASRDYWNSPENQRSFFDGLAISYKLNEPSDWKRVTISLCIKHGGKALLSRYNMSIVRALETLYPRYLWMPKDKQSDEQTYLFNVLKDVFPLSFMKVNYMHSALTNHPKPNGRTELDIWMPEYNVAFEYNGEQHYRETFSKSLWAQRMRDVHRKKQCNLAGITLIEVPYWWDRKKDTLIGSIVKKRPELVSVMKL